MKKSYFLKKYLSFLVIFVYLLFSPSLVFSGSKDIMLQGFHWESSKVGGWYNIVKENSQRIADSGFTYVWFPPPSQSEASEGYLPKRLYTLTSDYGTYDELKDAISTLKSKGVKALADIVINHRVGVYDWADFEDPYWPTEESICADDEWDGPKSPNPDTGEGYPAGRDLDHKHPTVQNGIKDWMAWLRSDVGFAGWRYDMVKGYAGWAIQLYNDHTFPEFSVGEYLDYDPQKVVNWIDSTHTDRRRTSTAFDFPLREVLRLAVDFGNYDYLKYHDKPSGVMGMWSDKSVTFIENHDSEEIRGGVYLPAFPDGDKTLEGYAYILTHPGTPTVFWKDVYDSGSYYESKIKELILIRKNYGIHSGSQIFIDSAEYGSKYAAYIQGDNGEVAVKIGPNSWIPSGEKWDPNSDLLASGHNYAVWGEHGKWW